jgi:hypothetical protein
MTAALYEVWDGLLVAILVVLPTAAVFAWIAKGR